MSTAGIVIIGDEILAGKFVEENAAFLIGELRALGVDLRRIVIIPDDLEDIATTVRALSARVDHVFTSGGVGPTHDDVTMVGIARAFDTNVVRHPDLESKVRAYWGDRLAPPGSFVKPVDPGAVTLTSGFGPRWGSEHQGIDLAAAGGGGDPGAQGTELRHLLL